MKPKVVTFGELRV